ncbi:hypothetical protein [Amycolatopsis sp. cmx-4-54]|uniref:hypothetical protein n=1 Tax=Amycolatopsis sp. cmx-4-54 TaxID=2790936 RepID=UPI0039795DFE
MSVTDAEQAGRLLAFGLRPRQAGDRDSHHELIRRFTHDDVFADLVRTFASGMGLTILDVGWPSGVVLIAEPDSIFETKLDDYAKYLSARERRDTQKMLHGIAHLAIAALGFPRADDLADDGYRGRVSVDQVDSVVRETCRLLDERAARAEHDDTPLAEDGELERAWRAYLRRPAIASTKDQRANAATTRQIIRRALKYLTERGLMQQVGEEIDEVYRINHRYQIQIREMASHAAFRELLELGVVPDMTTATLTGPGPGTETD